MSLETLLEQNDFESAKRYLLSLEDREIQEEAFMASFKFGILPLSLLIEIASEQKTALWYEIVASHIPHISSIDGATPVGYYYLKKWDNLVPSNPRIIKAILDYAEPPEPILSDSEIAFYRAKLKECS